MHRTFAVKSTPETPQVPLRVVLSWGCGPIGKNVADECARRGAERVEVVGAVDRDPKLVGKTLAESAARVGGWGCSRGRCGV